MKLLCFGGLARSILPFAAAQQKVGSEFRVNNYTADHQVRPAVAGLDTGDFIVVWDSNDQDGWHNGVYGQLFNESGTKIGSEFLVNTETYRGQYSASVATLGNGTFVVTWTDSEQDGSREGIYGQLFGGNGVRVNNEFQVNTYVNSSQDNSAVAGVFPDRFVAVWQSNGQDGSGMGGYGQLFNFNATQEGSEFQINTYSANTQGALSVSGLPTGEFVVVWQSEGQDGSDDGVYGQLFLSNGTKINGEFRLSTYSSNSQNSPYCASFSHGGFVAVWNSHGQDGWGFGIYGQRFLRNGTKIGSEFRVNTYTADDQMLASVAVLSNDGFVVTWQSNGQDGSGWGIYGQLFSEVGSRLGSEFQVNSNITSYQEKPSVAGLSNGNFVVTWQSDGQDGSGYGVYGQIFEPVFVTTGTSGTSGMSTTGAPISGISAPATTSSDASGELIWIVSGVVGGACCLIGIPAAYLYRRRGDAGLQGDVEERSFHLSTREVPVASLFGDDKYGWLKFGEEEIEKIYQETGLLVANPQWIIGEGNYGHITVCYSVEEKRYAAAKVVEGEELFQQSIREADLQRLAKGTGVWPILHTITDNANHRLIHLMPLAGLGNLESVRRRISLAEQEDEIAFYVCVVGRDMLQGLKRLHTKGIYHCDLKPANVIADREGNSGITDFGCAVESSCPEIQNRLSDFRYQSPQRWLAGKEGLFRADKDDAWAVGCTLLEFMTGQPVAELLDINTAKQALKQEPDRLLSHFEKQQSQIPGLQDPAKESIWEAIRGFLEVDEGRRLTPAKALKKKCFSDLEDEARKELFLSLVPRSLEGKVEVSPYQHADQVEYYQVLEGGCDSREL